MKLNSAGLLSGPVSKMTTTAILTLWATHTLKEENAPRETNLDDTLEQFGDLESLGVTHDGRFHLKARELR